MSKPQFHDQMTLGEARTILRHLAMDKGENCPCCTQFAKVYKRKIHASMAAALIAIHKASASPLGAHFVEISKLLPHNQVADAAKLRYWGLIEEEPSVRQDGSERTGWWRVTETGTAFVLGKGDVTKYVKLYNGRSLGTTGGQMSIREALGKNFNYNELMAA